MAEQTYREIQLTRKQLAFLFMSSVIVLFVAFLLGVSVGRSVGAPEGTLASAGTALDSDTLVTTQQPPTETDPGELSYHDDLQGGASTAGGNRPTAGDPSAGPVSTDPVPSDPLPAAPPPPEPDPVTPPAAQTVTPPPAQTVTPPPAPARPPPASQATGAWALQLGAYSTRARANTVVSELKGKGFAAFIETTENALFAVRVGPFQSRAQAEGMKQRLASDPQRYESFIISR